MADYTTLDLNSLLPGEPLTSEKALAFYENPTAIAEGAVGAPRIVDAALDTGASTTAGTTWVSLRIAAASVGGVGTYAFCRLSDVASPGSTHAGSLLRYTNAAGLGGDIVSVGTWRLMGQTEDDVAPDRVSLFLRIA